MRLERRRTGVPAIPLAPAPAASLAGESAWPGKTVARPGFPQPSDSSPCATGSGRPAPTSPSLMSFAQSAPQARSGARAGVGLRPTSVERLRRARQSRATQGLKANNQAATLRSLMAIASSARLSSPSDHVNSPHAVHLSGIKLSMQTGLPSMVKVRETMTRSTTPLPQAGHRVSTSPATRRPLDCFLLVLTDRDDIPTVLPSEVYPLAGYVEHPARGGACPDHGVVAVGHGDTGTQRHSQSAD